MKFGQDWPGVFIRGDDAYGYAVMLEQCLRAPPGNEAIQRKMVEGLIRTLRSCKVEGGVEPEGVDALKPWQECRA